MQFLRRKPIQPHSQATGLARVLTAFDLTLFGIGAIIGAGAFVLTGVAAATDAGPAITLSYVVAGLAALFSALSYAELSTSVGGSGSAYNYAYVSCGELIAWLIGGALVLEYAMSVATVAVGWSGYSVSLLQAVHINIPHVLAVSPAEGGWINLPAVIIIGLISFLLCHGTKQSALINNIIVFVKLIIIAIFLLVAVRHLDFATNWKPFNPFGTSGIMTGAAIVFFAYIGFDAIATTADETINPQRNLPIGIIASLLICTLIYVLIAAFLTGIVYYTTLNNAAPVSEALLSLHYPVIAGVIAVGAIGGLTTVMIVMLFGLNRILFAVARDGLLPNFFQRLHPKTKTPVPSIILVGTIIAIVSGFLPLTAIAELVNISTLLVFAFVSAVVVILRITQPALPRPFKLPANPLIPVLGMGFCIYLMLSLSAITWKSFIVWTLLTAVIYGCYSYRHSHLRI